MQRLCIIAALLEITSGAALAAPAPILSSVIIRGSTIYAPAELFAVYREHLGKPINREAALSIIESLAQKYGADGYARPRIRVEQALAAAGVLRFEVSEARVTELVFDGDPGPYGPRLAHLGARIDPGAPARPDHLRDVIETMRALPGLTVSTRTMQDPEALNIYRIELDTEFDPLAGSLRFTNRGTDDVGPNFVVGQLVRNGIFRAPASAGLAMAAATDRNEYRGFGFTTNLRLSEQGLHGRMTGFRARAEPSGRLGDRDVLYLRDRLALDVRKPLAPSAGTAWVTAGIELEDVTIDLGPVPLRDDRLRMLSLALDVTTQPGGTVQHAASAEIVKGLGGFGSGLDASDIAEDRRHEDFLLLRLRFTRLAHFDQAWSLRVDALAQHSSYVLPYTQRFKIGSEQLGRGYESAAVTGDRGAGAKVELRRRLRAPPRLLPGGRVYGFYDIGAAWGNDGTGRESAATAGIGLRVSTARTAATIELAQPLTHPDASGNEDLAVFLEATLRL